MDEKKTPQQLLIELALERAQYEYTELADNWKQLDTKAQGTAAIAGIFLAALVAILSKYECQSAIDIHAKLGAIALLSLLLAGIYFAVLAMRVVVFDMPPSGRKMQEMVNSCLDTPLDEPTCRTEYYKLLKRLTELWLACNDKLDRHNTKKAKAVDAAQRCLVSSAVLSALLAGWRILTL